MATTITVDMSTLVNNVKTGNYPDVPRNTEERLTIMPENLLANYSILMGQCLLNGIEGPNAALTYQKRTEIFDELMMLMTSGNFGRTNKLVARIESLFKNYQDDDICWPSKRQANNIALFAAEYFAWDDTTRSTFYNNNQPIERPEAEPVVKDVVVEANDEA